MDVPALPCPVLPKAGLHLGRHNASSIMLESNTGPLTMSAADGSSQLRLRRPRIDANALSLSGDLASSAHDGAADDSDAERSSPSPLGQGKLAPTSAPASSST